MFGKSITLFRLLGFPVKVDLSWLFIAALVTWSLSTGAFPGMVGGLEAWNYWVMGAVTAAAFFASILLHELSHSVVARIFGIPIKGITLFIFGGVAEMEAEPRTGTVELLMAAAGPFASVALSAVFFTAHTVGVLAQWPPAVTAPLFYMSAINGMLAVFNMLPAFPLDGGRVLRALLWLWRGDLAFATRIASTLGSGFGLLLIFLGIVSLFSNQFIGGLWWILIGFFLRNASSASYRKVLMDSTFEGRRVREFMSPYPVSAPASITLLELVENYVYRHHYKMYPVTSEGRLSGCVTTRDVSEVPKERWSTVTVGEIAGSCSGENAVHPDTAALKALLLMQKTGVTRLMVVEDGALVGVVTMRDLLSFMSVKLELDRG